jgi:hypothetical protein
MGAAVTMNVEKLLAGPGSKHPALVKYGRVGALLADTAPIDPVPDAQRLIEHLDLWTEEVLTIPRLGPYGVKPEDVERIVQGAENKNNPLALTQEDMAALVRQRL